MASETSPLLGPQAGPPESLSSHRDKLGAHFTKWRSLYICALFTLLLDVPGFMGEVPKLRMLELGVCRKYYVLHDPGVIDQHGNVPEHLCKVSQIQSSLAKMRGLLAMIEAVCGLIVAVPYGMLADKKGHRLVCVLCLIGFVLRELWMFLSLYFHQTIPLHAVYAAPLMGIIGGGSIVVSPMVLAIIAASTPAESRTTAFFWIQVTLLTTELVAPPLASVLMETIGPHLAFLAGIPVMSLSVLVLAFLPSTTKSKPQLDISTPSSTSTSLAEDGGRVRRILHRVTYSICRDVMTIGSMKSLIAGLCAMVVSKLARPILELTLQFMSVRFGWPLKRTSYLLSIQAATQIALFIFVLPATNSYLVKKSLNVSAANLALARTSIAFLAVGALSMGLSSTAPAFITAMVIHSFGSGYTSSMRSLVTSLVPHDRISLLYTAMAVFEGLAVSGASPLLQMSFSWGLDEGGWRMSLPFYIAASLYSAAALILFLGRFDSQKALASD